MSCSPSPRQTKSTSGTCILTSWALSEAKTPPKAMRTLASAARIWRAHVHGLHVRIDPRDVAPLAGEGLSGAMIEEMMSATERESAERAKGVQSLFSRYVEEHGIPVVTDPAAAFSAGAVSASFGSVVGREEDVVAQQARLSDFSIARLAQETTVRMTGVLGTADYMAPEVFAEQVSKASDVYGAGATACDLRYGSPPLEGLDAILDDGRAVVLPPAQSAPEAYFQRLVATMLEKDPARRFRDMGEPTRHFSTLAESLHPPMTRAVFAPLARDRCRDFGEALGVAGKQDRLAASRCVELGRGRADSARCAGHQDEFFGHKIPTTVCQDERSSC